MLVIEISKENNALSLCEILRYKEKKIIIYSLFFYTKIVIEKRCIQNNRPFPGDSSNNIKYITKPLEITGENYLISNILSAHCKKIIMILCHVSKLFM